VTPVDRWRTMGSEASRSRTWLVVVPLTVIPTRL
jgi:hypothetical protein